MSPSGNHSLLLHRAFQYLGIILVMAVMGGGYWYWKQARAGVEMNDNRPSFEAPLTHDLDLTAGQGAATFSRADGADRRATVIDFEGRIIPVKNGEARFDGARRVENLTSYSENMTSGKSFLNGASAVDADTVSFTTDATSRIENQQLIGDATTVGRTFRFSADIRGTPGEQIWMTIIDNTTWANTTIIVTLTAEYKRYTVMRTVGAGASGVYYRLNNANASAKTFDTRNWQFEDVTGQANQNPSEYVSVGVRTASPYHGAGVDGVKYFDTQNGNTVASNVVTEATGAAIATATLKGYLAEGTRANAALRSEEADNASWGKTNATISANAAAAPDGRTTADKIVEDTANSQHKATQNISTTAGSAVTFSAYAKKAERHFGAHLWNATDGTFGKAEVNLDTGEVISSTGTVYVEPLPSGWYRIRITATPTVASSAYILMPHNGSSTIYTGDGSSGVYVWGIQLEQAPFASSYIPTTSASVTRASDMLQYPETGNFNDAAGAISLETTPNWTGGLGWNAHWVSDSSSQVKLRIWHWLGAANHVGADRSANNGATRNQTDPSLTLTRGTMIKMAIKWDGTALRQFNNGALAASDTTLTLPYDPLNNSLYIGNNAFGTDHAFSSIRNVRAWKKALTDAELNNLTSLTQSISDSATKKTTVNASQEGFLTDGLVGYWPMNGPDVSGTAAYDRSGQGNNGTRTNGPTVTPGRSGQALSFDGTDDYVEIADNVSLSFGTNSFAVSTWMKLDGDFTSSSTTSIPIVTKYTSDTYNFSCAFKGTDYSAPGSGPSGAIQCKTEPGGGIFNYWYTGARTWTAGEWYHIVAIVGTAHTDPTYQIYVNGVASKVGLSGTATNNMTSITAPWRFGKGDFDSGNISGARYLSGAIDEPRIYNRALSASEIWDLYQLGNPDHVNSADSQGDPLERGMVGYWKLDDAIGASAADASGNGNTGTLTNGPTWTTGQIGGALSFSAASMQCVDLGNNYTGSWAGYTLSAWINPNQLSASTYYAIIAKGYQKYFHLRVMGNGDVYLAYNANPFSGPSTITTGNWYLVTWVINATGTTVYGYINGIYFGSYPFTESDTTMNISIGCNDGSLASSGLQVENPFSGSIDEVRIYNRALSTEEIARLYETTAPDNPDTGLVGYWSMNGPDVAGTTAYDRSGKGNNGTLTNSPTKTIGKVGQALSFNGTNSSVSLPNVANLKPTGDFAAVFWYKGLKGSAENFISHSPSPATNYWYITNTEARFCGGSNCSTITQKAYTPPSDNEWHHLAVILDRSASPDALTVYIDGATHGTATGTADGGGGTWGSTTLIGGPSWVNSGYRQGAMDEVRLYSRTLSASEVQVLYNAGR